MKDKYVTLQCVVTFKIENMEMETTEILKNKFQSMEKMGKALVEELNQDLKVEYEYEDKYCTQKVNVEYCKGECNFIWKRREDCECGGGAEND